MTAHELARQLLAGPDLKVVITTIVFPPEYPELNPLATPTIYTQEVDAVNQDELFLGNVIQIEGGDTFVPDPDELDALDEEARL